MSYLCTSFQKSVAVQIRPFHLSQRRVQFRWTIPAQRINLQLSSVGFRNRFLHSCCRYICPVLPLHLSGAAVVRPAVFELPLPFSDTLRSHFFNLYQLLVNSDSRNMFRSYRQRHCGTNLSTSSPVHINLSHKPTAAPSVARYPYHNGHLHNNEKSDQHNCCRLCSHTAADHASYLARFVVTPDQSAECLHSPSVRFAQGSRQQLYLYVLFRLMSCRCRCAF